jgi:WD40 repeat protein
VLRLDLTLCFASFCTSSLSVRVCPAAPASPSCIVPAHRVSRTIHTHLIPAPFQVTEYVRQHSAAVGTDPDLYLSAIDRAKSLLDLARNPFLLTLFVAALPKLPASASGLARVTRYRVYEAFVEQWFEQRGLARLASQAAAAVLGPNAAGSVAGDLVGVAAASTDAGTMGPGPVVVPAPNAVAARFELLSALLAGEMLRRPELGLAVELNDSDSAWRAVQEAVEAWLVQPQLEDIRASEAYKAAPPRRRRELEGEVIACVDAAIRGFATTCPLRLAGARAQFIHKSFMEYFCARLLLLAAAGAVDTPLVVRVARASAALSLTDGRLIQAEPEVLQFVADAWQAAYEGSGGGPITRARETLLAVVAASADRSRPDSGAAANAATVLNWVGESMSRQRWAGVVLDGADLSRARLCGSVLSGASLRCCRLEKAVLADVDASGADLTDVEFGDRVFLEGHASPVLSVALCNSVDGRLVVVSGDLEGTVRVWDGVNGAALCGPLNGHCARVNSVSVRLRPDGKLLVASGSSDKTVRLWNGVSGVSLQEPLVGLGGVNGVSLCPDGLMLASGGDDGKVLLWDIGTRSVLCTLEGHSGAVHGVALCAGLDKQLVVASGGADNTVRLWQWNGATCTVTSSCGPLVGHSKMVASVSLYMDLKDRLVVASGSYDYTIRLWDGRTGHPLCEPLQGHGAWVKSVALCGGLEGRVVLASASDDQMLRLWDGETGVPLCEALGGHSSAVNGVSLLMESDGRLVLASCSADRTVRLWDGPTSAAIVRSPLIGCSEEVYSVSLCVGIDGRPVVASGGDDGKVRLLDGLTGSPLRDPLGTSGGSVYCVSAGLHAGKRLIVAFCSSTKTVRLPEGSRHVQLGGDGKNGCSVFPGPDGRGFTAVGISDDDHCVQLQDGATEEALCASLAGHTARVWSVAQCAGLDGQWVVASGGKDGTLRLWHRAAETTVLCLAVGAVVSGVSVCLVPDGQVMAAAASRNTVQVWNATTGAAQWEAPAVHEKAVISVSLCVGLGGMLVVASGSMDKTVRLWNGGTGAALHTLLGHEGPVRSVSLACVSPQGHIAVASGGEDKTVRLWLCESSGDCGSVRTLCGPLRGHGGWVNSVSLGVSPTSADTLLVASGSEDGTTRLWSAPLTGHGKPALQWATQSLGQALDVHGFECAHSSGLTEPKLALLRQRGL